jgi:hypothetical protein
MGLIGQLTGWDQFGAQQNAVLASHLLDTTTPDLRQQIATRIVNRLSEIYHGKRSVEELLEDLNNRPRGVQMQFVALASIDLGISPNIPNHFFSSRVQNPYRAKDWVSEKEILYTVNSTKKLSGIAVNWPGNDVKIDFTRLLANEGDTPSGPSDLTR